MLVKTLEITTGWLLTTQFPPKFNHTRNARNKGIEKKNINGASLTVERTGLRVGQILRAHLMRPSIRNFSMLHRFVGDIRTLRILQTLQHNVGEQPAILIALVEPL